MQHIPRSGFSPFLWYLVLLNFLCAFSIAVGQNLVPNPGFESYLQLPCVQSPHPIQDLVADWMQPLATSTDYFNATSELSCNINPKVHGFEPHSGNAVIGLISYSTGFGYPGSYQEYAQVKLLNKLQIGQIYRLQLFARNFQINEDASLKTNNIGIAFSEKPIVYEISSSPQQQLRLPTALNESMIIGEEWTNIEICWRADKQYEYLLIGNFNPDSTIVEGISNDLYLQIAYYLIDDILVEPIGEEVDSHNSVFCPDQETLSLNAALPGALAFEWQDGSTDPTFTTNNKRSTSYWVDIQFPTCTYRDIFNVNFLPQIDLGRDTILCVGPSYVLTVKPPIERVIWMDGLQDTIRTITSSGNYSLQVLSDDCMIVDTVIINFVDCPGFIPNVITPNGDLKNDFFCIEYADITEWSLKIFNRWGEVVFYSDRYNNKWDADGLPDGTYYYILQSTYLIRISTGWIHVLR